jgi:WhiB family transcriptional regulator, redox-sensing transcriptional regulator
MRGPWEFESPACYGVPFEVLFPEDVYGRNTKHYEFDQLKRICGGCPHLSECRDWALRHEQYGWWAGMTPEQRRWERNALNLVGWLGDQSA